MHSRSPFLALLFSAACLAQGPPLRNPRTTMEDVAAGGRIFRSHCADCHGLNGTGGKGPDLTTGVFYHGSSDAALLRNISDGIDGTAMPGQFFSDDQVWQIVAFVRTLAAKASAAAPPGNAANGAFLFRTKGCTGCHLVHGEGGVSGPDLSFVGSQRPAATLKQAILDPNALVAMEYWRADIELENGTPYKGILMNEDTYYVQLLQTGKGLVTLPKRDFRKFEVVKTSAMPSYKDRLNDAEVRDLVAFLWTLQRPRRTE